jgi:stage II sporulation protein E
MDLGLILYIIPIAAATFFMGIFKTSLKVRAFCISGFLFVSSVCANIISGFFWYDVLLALIEALMCFGGVYIFSLSVPLIINARERRCIYDTEIISLFVLVSLLIKFTTRFPLFLGMDIAVVLSIVTLYLINLKGDISLGAAMGIVFGIVTVDTTDSITASIGAFALASFCSSVLKRYGKWGVVVGFVLAHTIMVAFFEGEVIAFDIFEIIFASLVFAILPKRVTEFVSSFGAKTVHVATESFIEEDKMQSVISKKLKNMSGSYKALAASYRKCFETKNMANGYIIRMIDTASSKICPDCGLKYNCWERGYKDSYKAMLKMLETAEEKGIVTMEDVPAEIASKCTKLQSLVDAFNRMFDIYKVEKIWNSKLNESRHLVSGQLDAVAESIANISEHFDMFLDIPTEKELRIKLDSLGIGVNDVTFLKGMKENFLCEVEFNKWDITKKEECLVKEIIEEITSLKTASKGINHTIDGAVLTLGPKNNFEISAGKASLCKKGEKFSGDSMLVCQNSLGECIAAISDGMGTGEIASEESSSVVTLLANFISSGMDITTSIELINSAFLLGSSCERFATVDVCSVNLNLGLVQFFKTGAPRGYIRDDNGVTVIEGDLLASRTLNDIREMSKAEYKVSESCLVVMVSDGVYDVFNDGKEDRLKQLLEECDFSNPQITASKIINCAMHLSGGEAQDDMSVIALNVWRAL